MSFIRLITAAFLSIGALTAPLAAGPIEDAISYWLDDNDAEALPILSGMALAGDEDAQLLLGQIEAIVPPGAGSPFVSALSRRDRINLLRSSGGLSGKSWLRVRAENGDDLATALLASRLPDADMDVVRALLQGGEHEAAQKLAWEIFDRGRWDEIFALAPDDPLLEQLDFVLWMRAYFASPPTANNWNWLDQTPATGRSGGMMMISLVAPVLAPHLQPSEEMREYSIAMRGFPAELIESGNMHNAATVMANQVENDANLATVHAYCAQTCPTTQGYCALQVIAQVGGADNINVADSPLERLIPQDEFMTSPRAVNQLRRWMASIGDGSLSNADVISQCARADITAAAAGQ